MTPGGEPVVLTVAATAWGDPWGVVAQLVLYTGLIVALLVLVAHFAWLAVRPGDDDGKDN